MSESMCSFAGHKGTHKYIVVLHLFIGHIFICPVPATWNFRSDATDKVMSVFIIWVNREMSPTTEWVAPESNKASSLSREGPAS